MPKIKIEQVEGRALYDSQGNRVLGVAEVNDNEFWRRRLAEGDAVLIKSQTHDPARSPENGKAEKTKKEKK